MKAKDIRRKLGFGLKKKKEEEKSDSWEVQTNQMDVFDVAEEKKAEEESAKINKEKIDEKIKENDYGNRDMMYTGEFPGLDKKIQDKLDEQEKIKAETVKKVKEPVIEHKEVEEPQPIMREEVNHPYVEAEEVKSEDVPNYGGFKNDFEVRYDEPKTFTQDSRPIDLSYKNNITNEESREERKTAMRNKGTVMSDYEIEMDPVDSNPIKATEEVAVVGSPLIKSARPVEPTILGLSSNLQVQELTFNFIESDPIVIPPIKDESGKLSARLIELENKYGRSVLPLDLCGIPDNVIQLKRHRIMNICGRRYSDGLDRIVNKSAFNDLINVAINGIKESIETGRTFRINITKPVEINGYNFTAPTLNSYEITKFVNDFKSYNPKVYNVSNGDVIIELGALSARI